VGSGSSGAPRSAIYATHPRYRRGVGARITRLIYNTETRRDGGAFRLRVHERWEAGWERRERRPMTATRRKRHSRHRADAHTTA